MSEDSLPVSVKVHDRDAPPENDEPGAAVEEPKKRTRRDRENGAYAGWFYLAIWIAIVVAIALYASGRSSSQIEPVTLTNNTTSTAAVVTPSTPADLLATVDGSQVTLSGAVPDEGAQVQMVRLAEGLYGRGNVVDELTVDDDISLAQGSLSVTGTAPENDERPALLQTDAMAQLGLMNGPIQVDFILTAVVLAVVTMDVSTVPILLAGTVPDQSVVDRLTLSAEAVYGEGNVDSSALLVGPSTMDQATISVTGTVAPGDEQPAELVQVLITDFSTSAVQLVTAVDVGDDSLQQVEEDLVAALAENPIVFTTASSQLSSESDAVLEQVAQAILAVPGIPVEIVGHTDNQGSETINQRLSDSRAESVAERLVELGVDPARLSTRGAGETEPIASNNTSAGRAANRRIEFLFERQ